MRCASRFSGAAVAGTGYLTRSEKITKGDLAGSTYGNPLIAAGKVTNTKLANPSLTVSAGTALSGGGAIALGGSGSLSVDPTAVQSRVSGTCSSGSAISSINQDETVGCQSPTLPDAWATSNSASVGLAVPPGSETVVASKMLPAGSYVINAKANLDNTAADVRQAEVTSAQAETSTTPASPALGWRRLPGHCTAGDRPLASTTSVVLECFVASGSAGDVQASYRALTAIQVSAIH